MGLEIEKEDKKIYLPLSYYWNPLLMTFGDISLNGHMAVFYLGDEDLRNIFTSSTRPEWRRDNSRYERTGMSPCTWDA